MKRIPKIALPLQQKVKVEVEAVPAGYMGKKPKRAALMLLEIDLLVEMLEIRLLDY